MVLGRATAVTLALKKRYDLRRGVNDEKEPHYLEQYAKETSNQTKKLRVLIYKKYPMAVWFFGTMLVGFGITVLVFILLHRHLLFEEFDHLSLIYKYLICIGLILTGLLAFFVSEITTFVVNRRLSVIMLMKTSIFCKKHYKAHTLSDFKSLQIVRRGHIARDTDTTNFHLIFIFEDGVAFEAFQDRKLKDIKKKYVDILQYINKDEGVDFANIKYRDEATTTLKEKFVYRSPFQKDEDEKKEKEKSERLSSSSSSIRNSGNLRLSDFEDSDDDEDSDTDGDDTSKLKNSKYAKISTTSYRNLEGKQLLSKSEKENSYSRVSHRQTQIQ